MLSRPLSFESVGSAVSGTALIPNQALPESIRASPPSACSTRVASMFSGSGNAKTGRFVCGSLRTSCERPACPVGGAAPDS